VLLCLFLSFVLLRAYMYPQSPAYCNASLYRIYLISLRYFWYLPATCMLIPRPWETHVSRPYRPNVCWRFFQCEPSWIILILGLRPKGLKFVVAVWLYSGTPSSLHRQWPVGRLCFGHGLSLSRLRCITHITFCLWLMQLIFIQCGLWKSTLELCVQKFDLNLGWILQL